MRPFVSILVSYLVAAAPASREEVFAEAQALWAAGDMEEVVAVFERARAEDPQPEYLFGQAHAEVKLGRCDDAVEHLRDFLNTQPPDDQRPAAEAELEKCGANAPEPEPEPEPPPPSSVQTPAASNRPVDAPPRRELNDGLGWGLVGAGSAMALVGTTLYGLSVSRIDSPGATPDEQAYRDRTSAAQRLGFSGLGVAAAGVAVITGGVIRLFIVRRRAAPR